jgi:HK97 family phage portal protein
MEFGASLSTADGQLTHYRAPAVESRLVDYSSFGDPALDDDDVQDWWLGGSSHRSESGVRVTRKVAFGYAPYWRSLSLISEDVGRCPLYVYERVETPDGEGKDRAKNHPAYYLLRHEPNDYMSAQTFKTTLTLHACDLGNGYAYIRRNGRLDPMELLPLDPEVTEPRRIKGELWYVTHVGDAMEPKTIPARDILHIKGPSWEGLSGIGWRSNGRETIGQAVATRRHQSGYYKRGAAPSMVIEVPTRMTPKAMRQLRQDWERMHGGADNAHKTAVLPFGAKATALSANARDAQTVETQQFVVRMISALTGVPPHKLGDNSRTAYNSLEQENQAYLDHALDPWLVKWEAECFLKLLTQNQKYNDTHVVSFQRQIFVQANLLARYQAYSIAKAARLMTSNEIRAKEDMNPLPGGNELDVTPNMQPQADPPLPGEDTPPQQPPEDSQPGEDT